MRSMIDGIFGAAPLVVTTIIAAYTGYSVVMGE